MQYVGDNTNHDIATIDGKNTHHSLGSIAIVNGKFNNSDKRRTLLPWEEKQQWPDIESIQGIPIKSYHAPDKPALNQIVPHPVV